MKTEKKKRGRPPKHKAMEFEGMTYEGAINHALDKEVRADLDKCLADKDESQLTDDERKYLKRKKEKKSYTLNVRFTESEMQDILSKCEQYGYKNKTEYIRDCVRARVDLTPDRSEIAECNRLMKRIGANINQILVRLYSTGHIYAEDITEIKKGVNEIWHTLLSIRSGQQSAQRSLTSQEMIRPSTVYMSTLMLAGADSAGASEDFRAVRNTGTGRTQILAYHMIQSFAPGEVTPEQAMQIGEELCDRYLKGDYQYVIAVHHDKSHLHCHIIFNNTNLYNGLSFTTEHNQGRKSERAWAELREISDEICAEHGISVISEPEKGHGVSHFERNMQKEGKSWKDKLRVRIAEVMLYSRDFKDFLEKCSECSIEYVYKPSNKVKLKFRLSGDGQQKFTRADTLGADFTPERIAEQIAEIQEKLSAANVTPDMLIEAPKPVVPKTEPKPTQTVTAPTKPKQSAEPETITETSETAKRKAAAEQVEKFFAARRARRQAQLDMLNATAINPKPEPSARTPQPTPTESKAPEKKEDPWKAIRGMGRANEIIADLEAGGVMSFSELSGFFFNTPHSDDHTTERADLKKKFTAIDTLIAKMKHRDELEPVYKEYQGKSGWSQSRFKKKNAATIEDYEQTVKYIKEHIKKYAVDGKPPTMLDLLEKSNKLKSKWNRLNVEHTAFLTKRETAKKYTRQVRQYINEQQMKREREKSRQRTQAKHRNKNTLE